MLRDSPYIAGLIIILLAMIGVGTVWYITDINEDSAVTSLNETLRATAISEVDLSSRVEPGRVYLNQDGHANIIDNDSNYESDFESQMLVRMIEKVTPGSIIRFDYALSIDDGDRPATAYELQEMNTGSMQWVVWNETFDSIRPLELGESIEGIRVRIRRGGDSSVQSIIDQEDTDYWSYQSTVEVNRSDKILTEMEEFEIVDD